MILNAFAVLDVLVCVLRGGLAVFVIVGALSAWNRWRATTLSAELRQELENRTFLLFLAAGGLAVLTVISWPFWYGLLQSYIPQWPGVMCVYGVTQIGAGSQGLAGYLPRLTSALECSKPMLIFGSGCWLVLHWINRQSATAVLTSRVLWFVIGFGALALVDVGMELTYIAIPKSQQPATGCCTEYLDAGARSTQRLAEALGSSFDPRPYYQAHYGTNAILIAVLICATRQRKLTKAWVLAALAATCIATGANAVFLVEIAAPRLNRLPYHYCAYDLIHRAPEAVFAIGMFVFGAFGVGWAAVANLFGTHVDTGMAVIRAAESLIQFSMYLCTASLVMLTVALALV